MDSGDDEEVMKPQGRDTEENDGSEDLVAEAGFPPKLSKWKGTSC